jgi:hypothetical protein
VRVRGAGGPAHLACAGTIAAVRIDEGLVDDRIERLRAL